MTRPNIEPSADMRQLAHTYRELFVALTREGFSPAEALQIIGATIAAAWSKGQGDGSSES